MTRKTVMGYCGVCTLQEPLKDLIPCSATKHYICSEALATQIDCWTKSLKSEVEEDVLAYYSQGGVAQCYHPDCRQSYNVEDLTKSLPKELMARYEAGITKARTREKESSDSVASLQKTLAEQTAGSVEKETTELKLLRTHLCTLFPTAKQCKRCHYGPLSKKACDDLHTHQGQGVTGGGSYNNDCPNPSCKEKPPKDFSDLPNWDKRLHSTTIKHHFAAFPHLTEVDLERIQEEVNGSGRKQTVCWELMKDIESQLGLEDPLTPAEMFHPEFTEVVRGQLEDGALNIPVLLHTVILLRNEEFTIDEESGGGSDSDSDSEGGASEGNEERGDFENPFEIEGRGREDQLREISLNPVVIDLTGDDDAPSPSPPPPQGLTGPAVETVAIDAYKRFIFEAFSSPSPEEEIITARATSTTDVMGGHVDHHSDSEDSDAEEELPAPIIPYRTRPRLWQPYVSEPVRKRRRL